MRCGNEQPSCLNCVAYKEICFYEKRPKKARPSNSQISRLEEENRLLQERLEEARAGKVKESKKWSRRVSCEKPTPPGDFSGNSSDDSDCRSTPTASPSGENGNNENPEFHGPTSVFFDEAAPHSMQRINEKPQKSTMEDVSTNLMAEAAAQRQLEDLHLSSDQLDLDGVEAKLAAELLSVFWIRSNSLFMLIYRPVFMRDWVKDGPYFSKLLLNAIYFNASRYVTDARYGATGLKLGERFRKRFKDLLGSSYDKSRITTMQALLLVSISLSAVGKDRSLAWLYSGLGFRMMFDLGLHTRSSGSLQEGKQSPEDLESNRRLFWSAFVIDKLQSFYQGRPANVQEADTMVPLLFSDHYEEFEAWHPLPTTPVHQYPYAPVYSVSTFFNVCKLSIIMNKILNKIYREKNEVQGPDTIAKNLNQLSDELRDWRRTLPAHLSIPPASIGQILTPLPSPHVLVMLIMFHVVQILLYRPFVSYGHLRSVLPEVAFDSFSKCTVAANSIAQYLESYNRIHSFQFVPFFLFYASYVSATIHVRIAARRHLTSDAFECLRMCLSVFDQNELNNPAVKKAKTVIHKLMDRMGVQSLETKPQMQIATPRSKDETPSSTAEPRIDQEKNPRARAAPESIPQMNLTQGWDINDLDFEAILQSFSRPYVGASDSHATDISHTMTPQLLSNVWSVSDVNQVSQNFDNVNQFGGGNMDDVLFGFDISNKEDEW